MASVPPQMEGGAVTLPSLEINPPRFGMQDEASVAGQGIPTWFCSSLPADNSDATRKGTDVPQGSSPHQTLLHEHRGVH